MKITVGKTPKIMLDEFGNEYKTKFLIKSGRKVYRNYATAGYWFWVGPLLVKITKAR